MTMQLTRSMINDIHTSRKSIYLSQPTLYQIPISSKNSNPTIRSRSHCDRSNYNSFNGRYKTELSQPCLGAGKYIKRYLPHGENGARWDSTLKLAPSVGTLSSHQGDTLASTPDSPQESARQLALWQGESASRSQRFIEGAVQRTYDRWFRPNFSRDESIHYLKKQPLGGFVIRTSSRYPGFYGLSLKAKENEEHENGKFMLLCGTICCSWPKGSMFCFPDLYFRKTSRSDSFMRPLKNFSANFGLGSEQLIRHFLIGEGADGQFQIQGTEIEPRFRSLVELVVYHCQFSGALPCVLCLPGYSAAASTLSLGVAETPLPPVRHNDADSIEFQALYLGTFEVGLLNGSNAVSSAMDILFRMQNSHLLPIVVSFRVSPEGVTLTDLHCRQFLRRHFGCDSFLYIGADPYGRTLMENDPDNTNSSGRKIFGFVVRISETSDLNSCHLFAQQFNTQPCEFIVETVKKTLSQERPYGF